MRMFGATRLQLSRAAQADLALVEQQALREERLQRATADVAAAKSIFSERCRADGVSHGFSEQVGDPFEIVGQLVRWC